VREIQEMYEVRPDLESDREDKVARGVISSEDAVGGEGASVTNSEGGRERG
jgi:hypothetical protein